MGTPALNGKIVLIGCALLVVGLLFGYLLSTWANKSQQVNLASKTIKVENKTSPLISGSTANITGQITKVEGNKVTVLNTQKQSDTFELAKNFVVIRPSLNPNNSSNSASTKDILLNADALLYLQSINGEYQVLSIAYRYIPPGASASSSATKQ